MIIIVNKHTACICCTDQNNICQITLTNTTRNSLTFRVLAALLVIVNLTMNKHRYITALVRISAYRQI